jgi:hypothetical protein
VRADQRMIRKDWNEYLSRESKVLDGSLSVIEFQVVFKQTIEPALGGKRLVRP